MRELVAACGIWLLPGGVVTLWLLGLGALLLLAVTPLRYATGGALRIFSIAVATQALLSLIAIQNAADLSAQRQNPSDALSAAGVALVASGVVAVFSCWLGRSWTPKPGAGAERARAIDWNREDRGGVVAALTLGVVISLLVLSFPLWGMILVLLLIFSPAERLIWSAGSIELGFALALVLPLVGYVWLSTGKRAALRAPVRPSVALPLAVLCCLLGTFGIFLSTIKSSIVRPALAISHDRALFELLQDSVPRDDAESFESAQRELRRRPSDRAHSAETASRHLRRVSGGPASMSAQLAALGEPRAGGGNACNDFLGRVPSRTLAYRGPPELAVIEVLLTRGATEEVLAWVTDPEVPVALRTQIVERWRQDPAFPKGKPCVDAQQHATRAGVCY
jgi:hypothetical protein